MKFNKQSLDYWASVVLDAFFTKKGYFVLGYTKSGTNWMRNLIRAYFEYDYPKRKEYSSSFFRKRVHHMHRFVPSSYFNRKTIYLIRDGRDTIVSRYFTMVRQSSQTIMKNDFIAYSGFEPTEENILKSLAIYIEFLNQYHKSSIDWKQHLIIAKKRNLFTIKYEDLKKDTASFLIQVIKHLDPIEVINENKIKNAIDYCSIENDKKNKKEDTGFFRKDAGKSGTWKNYFSTESAIVFNNYAGELLIEYGYEKDDTWIQEFKAN